MELIDISGRSFVHIKSKDNEKVKLFSKLSSAKYRKSEGLFIAEGVKLSREAVLAGKCRCLLIDEEKTESSDVMSVAENADDECDILILSHQAFEKISTEMAPQGIIAVCEIPFSNVEWENAEYFEGKRIIVLDGVRDPGNFGTIMRSALAFGVDCIVTSSCVDPFSPKTVRASMGAVFSVPVFDCKNVPDFLKALSGVEKNKRRVIGTVLREDSLEFGKCSLEKSDIIVIGNEGHGISSDVLDVCTHFVKIPIMPGAESLNAAIAASVVMWEYSKL